MMKLSAAAMLGFLIVLAIVLVPIGYRSLQSVEYRNLRVVEEGKFYRSGRMTPGGFQRVSYELKLGTVICLRDTKDESGEPDDRDEEEYCRENGIAFHRMGPTDWSPVNGVIPGDQSVATFLRILGDPKTKWPVLIHCFAGIHRTGAHVAVYRMEYDGWSPAEAIAEMKSMGTVRSTFAPNLITYLEAYRPRRAVGAAANDNKMP